MADASLVESISQKYRAILADLDERGNRRWAAAEAISLGRGGIVAVALANHRTTSHATASMGVLCLPGLTCNRPVTSLIASDSPL